jgi:hypothetical protein
MQTQISVHSAQSLLIEMRFNGQVLSTGTAFVCPSPVGPVLLTNRHNVTGRDQNTGKPLSATMGTPNKVVVMHNRNGIPGQWVPRLEPLYSGDAPRWDEHPTLGPKADFVALRLTQLVDVELLPYDPSKPGVNLALTPADPVSVIGFPFGLTAGGVFGVWATGFLASEPAVDFDNLPVQLIDCRTRPGQSGSPVIAHRNGGMVALEGGSSAAYNGPVAGFLGIYSGRINKESDIGIVWKASAIQQLLTSLK